MPSPVQLPNSEKLVIDFLVAQLPAQPNIGSRWLSNYDGSQEGVIVSLEGSIPTIPDNQFWTDRPSIQVRCYASDKSRARELAAEVRSYLVIAWQYDHVLGVVSDSYEDIGLQWVPDDNYGPAGSYTMTFVFLIHPH